MRTLGSILKAIGIFSLVMTGLRLWQVGFPRLEGPEGTTWANVFKILAPYAIMGLISFGILGLGGYFANRPLSKEEEMERDERVVNFYQTTLSAWSSGRLAYLHESFKKSADAMRLADLMKKYQPYNEITVRTLFENFRPVPSEFMIGLGYSWFVLTNLRLIQKDGKTNEFKEVILADIDTYEIIGDDTATLMFRMKSGTEIHFENAQGYPKPEFISKLISQTIKEIGIGSTPYVVIGKTEIAQKNYSTLIEFINSISLPQIKSGNGNYSRMAIAINGYDNDIRSIWDIPEVVEWYKELHSKYPYMPLFLSPSSVQVYFRVLGPIARNIVPPEYRNQKDLVSLLMHTLSERNKYFSHMLGSEFERCQPILGSADEAVTNAVINLTNGIEEPV